jgi:hypothetical protein
VNLQGIDLYIGQRVMYRQFQMKRGPDGKYLVIEHTATVVGTDATKWRSVKIVLDDPGERPRWVTAGCLFPVREEAT